MVFDNMKCKNSKQTASAYLDRELQTQEMTEYKGHLTGCADCQSYLSDLNNLSYALASLSRVETPRELHSYVMGPIRREVNGQFSPIERLVDFCQKLNPRLVSYGVGLMMSGILFGLTLAGLRPDRIIEGPMAAPYYSYSAILGTDEEFDAYNNLPPHGPDGSLQHVYELPRVVQNSSLISFSNVAYRKPGNEGAWMLVEIGADGRAKIIQVLEKPNDPDVIGDLQWSLSKRPFQPAVQSGRPVQTRIVLLVEKVDIWG
jgi:hypothetical protein